MELKPGDEREARRSMDQHATNVCLPEARREETGHDHSRRLCGRAAAHMAGQGGNR
jgi:hypothetical protein